jgi:uncharacterized protein (UPF0332 family)
MLTDRDITDSSKGKVSNDRKFNIAYSAILHLCLIPLYCKGYRISRGEGHHYRTIQSVVITMGAGYKEKRDYFDSCRTKRNISDYDLVGTISNDEASEILDEVKIFRKEVETWVKKNFHTLLPP